MPRPTLKRRPDGRYRVKYKGKEFYGSTQSEAYAARDAYKRELEHGLRQDQLGISVRSYAARWVATYKNNVTPNTYNAHVRHLERFCEDYGDRRMLDITPTDIKTFLNRFSDMSYSSISKHSLTIKALFKSALGDRIITFDPTLQVPQPKGHRGSHRAISAQERALIQATQHRMRPCAMVMLFAGLRRGEAMALNIDRDVDFDNGLIYVREAVRDENGVPVLASPKSRAGIRAVPLLDILSDELHGKHGLLLPSASGDIMSLNSFNSLWASYVVALETQLNSCHKRWYGQTKAHKQLLQNGGILPPWQDVDIRPHDLRHSFCTLLYETGVDLKTATKWMGHADHNMIMKIYAHLTEEQERLAYRKLAAGVNEIIGGQNGGQAKPKTPETIET